MTEIINDNPAQKLLDILEKLRIRQDQNCWLVWCDVLSIENKADFPVAFAKLVSLIDEIVMYLNVYEPDAVEDCMHLKEQMYRAMMGQKFSEPMGSFIGYFDIHALKDLRHFSRLMKNFTNVKKLEQAELDEISQKMQDLKESVIKAENISERLRLSISKYINRILHLVEQYQISSSEEILLNIEALAGHLAMSEEGRELFNDNQDENSLGKKIGDTLTNVASICTILTTINPQIGVTTMNLIGKAM